MTFADIIRAIGVSAVVVFGLYLVRMVGEIRDALFDLLDLMEEGGLNDSLEGGE